MPDDALLAVRFINWLVQTPWWVPVGLMIAWMLFLTYNLWPTKQIKDELNKLYWNSFEKMIEDVREELVLARVSLSIGHSFAQYEHYNNLMSKNSYDFSIESDFKRWFRAFRLKLEALS